MKFGKTILVLAITAAVLSVAPSSGVARKSHSRYYAAIGVGGAALYYGRGHHARYGGYYSSPYYGGSYGYAPSYAYYPSYGFSAGYGYGGGYYGCCGY